MALETLEQAHRREQINKICEKWKRIDDLLSISVQAKNLLKPMHILQNVLWKEDQAQQEVAELGPNKKFN